MDVGVMTEIDWATTLETLGAVFEGAGLTEAVAAATGGASAFANYMGLGSGIATAGGQAISTSVATGTASQALAVYTGEQALSGAATRGALSAMNYALAEGTSGLTVGGVISATAPVLLAAGAAALGYHIGEAFNQTELGKRVQEKLIQLTDPLFEKGVNAYRCFVGPDGQVYAPKEIIDNIKHAFDDEDIDAHNLLSAADRYVADQSLFNTSFFNYLYYTAPFKFKAVVPGRRYYVSNWSMSGTSEDYGDGVEVTVLDYYRVYYFDLSRDSTSIINRFLVSEQPFRLFRSYITGGRVENIGSVDADTTFDPLTGKTLYYAYAFTGYRDSAYSEQWEPTNPSLAPLVEYQSLSNICKSFAFPGEHPNQNLNWNAIAYIFYNGIRGGDIEGLTKFEGTSPVDYTDGSIEVATGSIVNGTAETITYVPISIASNNPLVTTDAASATAPSPWEAIKDFISNVAPEIGYQPGTAPTIGNRTTVTPNPADPSAPAVDPSADPSIPRDRVKIGSEQVDPSIPISVGSTPVPWVPWLGDTGIIPHAPDFGSYGAAGLIHVYNPSNAAMANFGAWLFATYEEAGRMGDPMLYNNPFDGVIEAFEIYVTPVEAYTEKIRSGFLLSDVTAPTVRQRYISINCGNVVIPEQYGNYLDYAPYTKASVYLPFIGIVELEADDIVGHAVNITYYIDCYNGACIAQLSCAIGNTENLLYQFSGNCSVEVPMAGGSQAAIKAAFLTANAQTIGSVVGGIASGIAGLATLNGAGIASGIGQISSGLANAEASRVSAKSTVQHSGSFGASYGAMGLKKPYIIVRSPVQKRVYNYAAEYGYPAHKKVRLGDCAGYLRCKEVHVISATASDDEKALIEAMLKSGVFMT